MSDNNDTSGSGRSPIRTLEEAFRRHDEYLQRARRALDAWNDPNVSRGSPEAGAAFDVITQVVVDSVDMPDRRQRLLDLGRRHGIPPPAPGPVTSRHALEDFHERVPPGQHALADYHQQMQLLDEQNRRLLLRRRNRLETAEEQEQLRSTPLANVPQIPQSAMLQAAQTGTGSRRPREQLGVHNTYGTYAGEYRTAQQ